MPNTSLSGVRFNHDWCKEHLNVLPKIWNGVRLAIAPTPWYAGLLATMLAVATVLAFDTRAAATAVLGVVCMSLCFTIGHRFIRWILLPGMGVCGVARTLVDEAIRMKVVLVFIIGLLLTVSFLPFLLDPNEYLKYRIQLFLTWTLSGSALLLSMMTLFLACGTICYDLSHRHIFLTLTKPIGRGEYLLGKWLGIALLNLLLVSVVGIGVYTFAKVLQQQQSLDAVDRHAVDKQIMVARQAVGAQPPTGMVLADQIAKRHRQLVALATNGSSADSAVAQLRRARQQVIVKWHTIPPRDTRSYLFTNLDHARSFSQWIQLRMKPVSSMTPPNGRVRLAIWLNGRPYPVNAKGQHVPIVIADDRYHVLDLPLSAIDLEGNLTVRMANINLDNMRATFPSSISFAPGEGLEMLYQVDRFEPNLIRALLMIWIRLGFLAMLGLMAGSFLSFPVACLLGMLVYATAAAKGFLLESMQYYVSFPGSDQLWWDRLIWVPQTIISRLASGEVWGAFKILVRLLGTSFASMIPSFSNEDAVSLVADGRYVPYDMVVWSVIRVGVIWTGCCALMAWSIFRRRELARVTV